MSAKRALTRLRAPDEPGAEERAWEVVRSAYREQALSTAGHPRRRLALALALGALLAGVVLSPATANVTRLITRALGVEHASHALVSLPAQGRLLVAGQGGTWSIGADGSTHRLGPWRQASWSPHGLNLTVAGRDQLLAVDPRDGTPHWTLTRAEVSDPRWYEPTGYRVAYRSGNALREVAGDGTGDHLLAGAVAPVAAAWRPGHPYQLAYVSAHGSLVVRDGDTGQLIWSVAAGVAIRELTWSPDGRLLLALSPAAVEVYDARGRLVGATPFAERAPAIAAALSPDGHTFAVVLGGSGGEVVLENLPPEKPAPRRVLAGAGLQQLLWSPDGRWLLVSWPAANQWVFVRVVGAPRIAAASRIAEQFATRDSRGTLPRLEGWCCTPAGASG